MSARKRIVLVSLLLGLAFACWLLQRSASIHVRNTNELGSIEISPTPAVAGKKQTFAIPVSSTDLRWKHWVDEYHHNPNFAWTMPITFYAKVIDEAGRPIEGVNAVMTGNDMSSSGNFTIARTTDENGLFSLLGANGKFLAVKLDKPGYYVMESQNQSGFEFADFWSPYYYRPDANNPVIFHMRKKGAPAALIYRTGLEDFPPDGKPWYVDLKSGVITDSSNASDDIAITIQRPSSASKPYSWSVTIGAVGSNGGVLESNDEFMFEAPDGGYQKSIVYQQSASDPDWKGQVTKRFFVCSRDGQLYARVEAEIIPNYQDSAAIQWQYYVNPSGSRNLEYDPAEKINPQ